MIFLVRDLNASRVNLHMNDYCAGLPSPLAFLGLAAAIAPALSEERWNIGVLPILHEVTVSEGRTKAEAQKKADGFAPIEIAEDLIGSIQVSLLLDVPNCSDEHKLAEVLSGKRISGGLIHNTEIKVDQVTADGSAFSKVRRGYAMLRAGSDKSFVIAHGSIDQLKELARVLFPAELLPGSGWFVPVAVGHRLLEDAANVPKRSNTRHPSIPHVFAEPVVGIAELVSVRNKRLTESNFADLFWRWKAEGDWIVGHPNYHPNHHVTAKQENENG